MTLENLDNLVRIGNLKREPPDQKEFDGMVESARCRLHDARIEGLSDEGCFSLAYGAAHAISLAALRWHGYRSDNRFLVFQCLQHTVELDSVKWRVLDQCHIVRNRAEYEGALDISRQLISERLKITEELIRTVEKLGSVAQK